jgi:toxin CcdB
MAQFDVYKNIDVKTRTDIPYLLDIQADLFDVLATRVVIPLCLASKFGKPAKKLNPHVKINGKTLILSTAELAGVPKKILGTPVTSLHSHRYDIINALDFLFTSI